MSAFGFSAFVDGFFKGREIREGREDRKRQIERQEKMDKILLDREARAAEMHGLDIKTKQQGLTSGQLQIDAARRQRENEEAYRKIFEEGMADPEPDSLGAKPEAKSGTPEASAAVQGVAANLPRPQAPSRAADAFIRAVPLESLGAKVVGGVGSDTLAGGGGTDTMGQAPVSAPGGPGAPRRAATMAMQGMGDPSRMMYEEALRRQAQMQGPQRDPARVRGDVVPPPVDTTSVNPSYTENRPDRFAPDPQPPRVVAPPPPAGPDRRMQFEPLGVPRNDWQVPPRVEVQEAAMAAMAPPRAAPAPQGPQLDRRAEFDPPVDPRRPLSELAAFSPEQIRQSAQRDPNAGPTFAERAYEASKPNYDHRFGQNGNLLTDVAEAGKRVLHTGNAISSAVVGNQIETAKQSAGMAANTVNTLVNPWSRYAFDVEAPLVPGAPLGPGGILGPRPQAPAAAGPDAAPNAPPTAPQAPPTAPNAPLGARQTPATSATPTQTPPTPTQNPLVPPPSGRVGPTVENAKALQVQQAAQAVGPAAAVAVEEAQKVAKGPIGATDTAPLTPKQRERAATSAMDRYTTTVVPRLIEEMLKRGDVDRAIKFQEFMQAAETKRAMKDYVHMVVAAGEQDIETFGKHFIAAYNRLGYYNDGTTIVADKSKFTTDENGAVNGAILTFRNEETGDTYERVYDDPNQLYLIGLAAADPLNAFTETAARIKSANEAALGARKEARKEAITEAREAEKERQKNISEVAKLIFEQASKEFKPITYEMALQEARRLFPPPEEAQEAAPPPLLRKN